VTTTHRQASLELARIDPVMAGLVARHGPRRIGRIPPASTRFESLARAIAHQQLNGRAAETIWGRTRDLVPGPFVAAAVLEVPVDELRGAGLSGAKVASLLDLAAHVADGRVRLENIGRLDDDEIVDHLVAVRGIGPWTAHMFMISVLGRLDVWPTGDYGVRAGYARAWNGGAMPTPRQLEDLGDRFRPYRSVVAWYCWRAADDPEFG
jgi:DNA-3-methyladenine glycosylase II